MINLNINYKGRIDKNDYRIQTFTNIRNFVLIAILLSSISSILEKGGSFDMVFVLSFMRESVLRSIITNLNFLLNPPYTYFNFSVFIITFLIPLAAILSLTPIVLSQVGLMVRRQRDLSSNPWLLGYPLVPYLFNLFLFSRYGAKFMNWTEIELSLNTYVFIYIAANTMSIFLVLNMLGRLFFKDSKKVEVSI